MRRWPAPRACHELASLPRAVPAGTRPRAPCPHLKAELKGSDPAPGVPGSRPAHEVGTRAPEEPLVCARCAHPITRESHRIEVDGHHVHTRINPAGHVFHFGCFAHAEGCLLVGPPTDEHTWFAAHVWQYAHCASCRAHLGWGFQGPGAFFGLVLERLARPS